jgi:hypothetical protein
MKYSDFKKTDAYVDKHTGSAVRIVIYDATDPTTALIGRLTGINGDDGFEIVPIEESGEDGVNEIAVGRHAGNLTINGFFTPERNDRLPTRQNFLAGGLGKEFTVMQVTGDSRIGDQLPLNVFVGCKCSRNNVAQGARGVLTFDLAFSFTRRYSGEEWATLAGNA